MMTSKSNPASTTFADLGVPPRLVQVLTAGGITAPFPIQADTLPDSLAGRDVLGHALLRRLPCPLAGRRKRPPGLA